jgi:monofunctional biosynthetic peptidoglycan transglycosylase
MSRAWRQAGRLLALFAIAGLALQIYFVGRVGLMALVDPASTAFQRSEIARLLREHGVGFGWQQAWVPYEQIAPALKRAVIASEDAGFAEHSGVEWEAIEKAWEKNQRAVERAERANERIEEREARLAARRPDAAPLPRASPKLVGGSTITQQLAKNLFLSGERSVLRKGQEVVLAYALEALLPKRRILEIYLNHVEWGEGVFGAQAAARHYFKVDAARLGVLPAARLAVMLPAPKRFERWPASAYVLGRAATVAARMGAVEPP